MPNKCHNICFVSCVPCIMCLDVYYFQINSASLYSVYMFYMVDICLVWADIFLTHCGLVMHTWLWSLFMLAMVCTVSVAKPLPECYIPENIFGDKSIIVQVMARCRQATNHYLSLCWPRSMSLGHNELNLNFEWSQVFDNNEIIFTLIKGYRSDCGSNLLL